MAQRLTALALFLAAGAWFIFWELVRASIYERVLHKMNPYIDAVRLDQVVQYGVPLAFAAVGTWLFWRTGRGSANLTTATPAPAGAFIDAPIAEPVVRATEEPERVFVPPELTPERLFSFYQGTTNIQAAELTKPYIGQWMTVTGTLGSVGQWTGFFSQLTFERSKTSILERTWLDFTTIYMNFRDPKKIDRLKSLKHGDKITVIGQLKEVDRIDLHLDNCELVDANI